MNTYLVRTMNRFLRPCLAVLFALGVMAAAVPATYAQIERQISYQGLLTLPTGLPLDDGQYDLVLRMYDAPIGGNLLWEETQTTTITKGLFNLYLGSVVPLTGVDFFNTQVYLETALAGQPPFPRTRLAVVPYAIRAERAGVADSINVSAGGFVRSLNQAEGNLVIAGKSGIVVTRTNDTINIESTITFQGISNLSSPQNTIEIVNPNGPNTTVDVRDGAITAVKIADSVITTAKLVDSLIVTSKIADGAVTASKIGPGVIPSTLPPSGPAGGDLTGTYPNPLIALGAVTGPKIADGAVSTTKITDGAITTSKLADNSITTTKVADGAITAPKLTSSGVVAGTYGDNLNIPRITVDDKGRVTLISVQPLTNFPFIVVAGGDLTGTYPDPLIRTNAVTTSKILDLNVTTSKIADLAITTPKIAIGAVRSEQVADGSITVLDLAPGTIPTTLPPSGPASGDLAGFYPSPVLSTSAAAGSRMVDALRSNFIAGDVDVNTANNIVMLNALGQFPAANGSLINNLNVNNVGSGVLGIQFGGTNSSTALNNNRVMVSNAGRIVEAAQQGAGQLLIGTGASTAPAVGQIVAGTGMTVTYSSPNIIIASTTQPGTASDQTLRWDAGANAWVPTSNILSSAAGNLTVNGNTILGDAAGDAVRMNGATVGMPNVPTTTASSNILVRNPLTGNLEVSTANFSTSTVPLSANTAVRTNATGQLESVALTNGQLLVGSTGNTPQAATITGTANRVSVTNGPGSITLSLPQDIATTSNVNFNSVTTTNNVAVGTSLSVGGAATVGGTLAVTGGTTLNSTLTQSGGQVTFNGNVDANSGLDVSGATTMNGSVTQSGGQVTFSGNVDALNGLDVAGATTMSGSLTQSIGQVTFGGNVDANNGLDVTGSTTLAGNVVQTGGSVTLGGATTVSNTFTQTGVGQVTFGGNVDATNGLDVTGANFTVGGSNFVVNPTNGNTSTNGTLGANGAVTFNSTLNVAGSTTLSGNVVAGDGNGDNVTINTAGGGILRMNGLPNVAGADVVMISATNDVSRFPITGLVGADEGLTYNEAGSAKVRLGATTTTASTMTGNRFVNMGNNNLSFTTNAGNATVMMLDGDATNYGVDLFAAGTGAIDLTGATRIVGATTVTGAMTQSSGQVTMGGNVDANSGLDVIGGNLTVGGTNFVVAPATGNTSTSGTLSANGAVTFSSTLNVAGTTTLSGNVVAGDGTGDNVTINTAGGGAFSVVGLPVIAGTDVLMANGANVVTRAPIAALINADQGITYNEGGLGFIRLGAPTNLGSPLVGNRFVNLANNDLRFTTNGGAVNLLTLDGDATNYGVAINAGGTGSIALTGATNITGTTTMTGAVSQGGGQVTFNGNVDAGSGLDVTGLTTMTGNVTQSGGTVAVGGATTINNTLTQTGASNQVTFNGNVDATNGLDVTGATTFTGTVTQSGGQATFTGNLDATNGLDVTGQDLTVGGSNFTVTPGTGNTNINGAINVNGASTLNGNVTLGNGTSDNVTIDVSGGAGTLRMNGLIAGAGTDLLMINGTNVVSRTPLADLIDADQGVTYNEAGSGKMRLGSTTNAGSAFATNRFINLGNNDLTITTNNGATNLVLFDGDATNAGVTVSPTGTGLFTVAGGSNLTGAVTAGSTLTVTGNTTLNGNVVAGNGTGDDVTINVSGAGGELVINGLPVVAGTEVLMSNGANVISKTPLAAIVDADQGISYNEGGSGKIRLGTTTNTANALQVDRYVNLGNFDLFFTTSGGGNNVMVLDGGALNYGATINAGGTGAIALNGPTNITGLTTITGNTTVTGSVTQNGGSQVTFSGNVDATNGLDVSGAFTVGGASTLTGTLVQSGGAVNLGGATTIGGATTVNNTLNVSGATTLSSSLTVNGNTTLGDAAADNLTVNAATVTMANLPTATTVNKFIMSGTGGALQVREINNIVTGTGTPNRLTRWDATGAGILDASLSDDGAGVLTRSGNIAINPGAAFTLSTNGNFSVNGSTTLTGTTNMNGAVNIGNGGDAVAVNVTGSQLTVAGLATAVGTDVLMANGTNVVSRTPITSLINADQGLTYNEAGSAMVRLGSVTRNTSAINANRFIEIGNGGKLTFTTNGGNAADDMFVLTGGAANYGASLRSKGTGTIALKSGAINGTGDVTSGSYLNLTTSNGAQFKYADLNPGINEQEIGVLLEPSTKEVIIISEDLDAGTFGELRVKGTGVEFSGTLYQTTPDLVQFAGDVEMAKKLDVVGDFRVFADRFTVEALTGNTAIKGNLNVNGNVDLGDGLGSDNVTANVTGGAMKFIGLQNVQGNDVLMINNTTNIVSRTPITDLIGADQGLTYNEDGTGKVRLGATTSTVNTLTMDRYVNVGNNDLYFTTAGGAQNMLVLNGDANNSGVAVNALGTGTISLNGTTNINTGTSTSSTSIGNTTGAFTLVSSNLNISSTGVISDLVGPVEINDDLSVTGATNLALTLTVEGATNLNGAVTMGNGDADQILVNSTSGLVIDTDAGANMTITESAITRSGPIAVNPGTGNAVTTNGSLIVDQNATVRGNANLGDASTDVITVTGQTNITGTTNINSTGSAATTIGTNAGGLTLRGSTITMNGPINQTNGAVSFAPGVSNGFTVVTDGAIANGMNLSMTPLNGTISLSSAGNLKFSRVNIDPDKVELSSLGSTGNAGLTTTGTGTASLFSSATTNVRGGTSVTINTQPVDGSTTIGNTTNALTLNGSTTSINTSVSAGSTTIGNAGAATSVTLTAGVGGNIVMNNVATDAAPTFMLSILNDGTGRVRRTELSGTANQGVIFSNGQYLLGGTSATEVPFAANRFVNLNSNNLSFTSNGGAQTPLAITGGVNSGVALRSNGTGSLSLAGATNINTTVGSGTTTIGNTNNQAALSGSTVTVTVGAGDLVLQNIAADAAPTEMLTITGTGAVRRTNMAATAEQGVIYDGGKYKLGGANSTEVPFTSDRFVNIDSQNLNFTTSAGTLLNLTGSTATVTGNVTQTSGDVNFTPGAGKTFNVIGTMLQSGGSATFTTGTDAFTVDANGVNPSGTGVSLQVNTGTGGIAMFAEDPGVAISEFVLDPTVASLDATGSVRINTAMTSGSTIIGSTTNGGAVSLLSSGTNDITIDAAGDLILNNIDTDPVPTHMLTITGTGAVRKTEMSATAEQGVIYDGGKYKLGGATSTEVPFTTDRFVNIDSQNLNFTTSAGTLLNLNGSTVTMTGNVTQTSGDVNFTPGVGKTFNVTGTTNVTGATTIAGVTNINTSAGTTTNIGTGAGVTNVNGTVNINTTAGENTNIGVAGGTNTILGTTTVNGAVGSGNTTIGNSANSVNVNGSLITLDGVVDQLGGSATFTTGTNSFTVDANGVNPSGTGVSLQVNTGTGGIAMFAEDPGVAISEFVLDPTVASLDATGSVRINTAANAGTTTIGSTSDGGAVSILSSGLNNITVDAGGDLVLNNIDLDATPTQMLTITGAGAVRKTDMSATAEQGVIYDGGKYKLGGATSTEVPFTSDRFVNIDSKNLNFTTASGTLLNLTGTTASVTGNLNQSGGNVNITPGSGKSLTVTGTTTVKGANILLETTGGTSKTSLTMDAGSAAFAWNEGATTERSVGFDVDGIIITSSQSGVGFAEIEVNDGAINLSGNTRLFNDLTVDGNSTLGNSTTADQVTIKGVTNVQGNTTINGVGVGTTTIGNDATGGAVSVASSGVNNITVNPGGDLVLQNIDVDAAPTQMLTLTAGGAVRKTTMSSTAEQGVIYDGGKYKLGGATNTEVPFTTDRFVNISNKNLNFTTTSGTLLNLTGTTATVTGNVIQTAGDVGFTPGAGKTFSVTGTTTVTGATTISGVTNINTAAGTTTNIGTGAGTTNIRGTVNINTTAGENTNIGIGGGTNTILGTTNINKTGTESTWIGNSSGTLMLMGPTTLAGSLNQTGAGQVTFSGNVDAANGLDVTNASLTVGGPGKFQVSTSGNVFADGNLAVNGNSTLGSQNLAGAGDNVTIDVRGGGSNGNVTMLGLQNTGTFNDDVLMITSGDLVRRRSLADLLGAEYGITYNEAGNGKMRLGSASSGSTAAENVLGGDRFINQGAYGIDFTWLNGATTTTMLQLKQGVATFTGGMTQTGGDVDFTPGAGKSFDVTGTTNIAGTTSINTAAAAATNIGAAGGTNTILGLTNINKTGTESTWIGNSAGTLNLTGATTLDGSLNQTGAGQVTFSGNVDATNGLDVTNASLMVGSFGEFEVSSVGNVRTDANLTVNGNSTLGSLNAVGAGDNVTIDVRGGGSNGDVTMLGLQNTGTFNDDVLMITSSDLVRRRSLADLLGAEYGITYNEAGNGKMRLGSATSGSTVAENVLGGDRFINQGAYGIDFTWLDGATTRTMLQLKQGAATLTGSLTQTSGDVDFTPGAGKTFDVNGTTNITGATTIEGVTNINTAAGTTTNIGTGAGTTNLRGTVNINTTSGENTNIGVAGGTNTILGTTNINTTGTESTSIGNTTGTLTLTGATTLAGSLNQTGAGQVTFSGNVDAANGLDVTNNSLTVGGAAKFEVTTAGTVTADGDLTVNGSATIGNNPTGDNVTINGVTNVNGATTVTGATTITGATQINIAGAASTTIGNTNGGAVAISSGGANDVTIDAGGDLNLQNIDTDAAPTEMLTITAAGDVRKTTMAGTADQGVSYTNGKYQLGSTTNTGVPLTQNRFVNASDFTLDFTYNDAGTQRSMFRLNDGEVVVTAPNNFRVIGPTSIRGTTQINNNAGDGSTAIGNAGADFSLTSNNLNISTAGVISDASGDIELNDNTNVTGNLSVTGQIKGAGVERLNSAAASNKFAERVRISGTGTYVYTITNSQFTANSVVVLTLEDYTGPGILSYQIKRPKDGGGNVIPGSIEVYFSQPVLGGESVVVNVMVVNQ
jgi:hypothetical protein